MNTLKTQNKYLQNTRLLVIIIVEVKKIPGIIHVSPVNVYLFKINNRNNRKKV